MADYDIEKVLPKDIPTAANYVISLKLFVQVGTPKVVPTSIYFKRAGVDDTTVKNRKLTDLEDGTLILDANFDGTPAGYLTIEISFGGGADQLLTAADYLKVGQP